MFKNIIVYLLIVFTISQGAIQLAIYSGYEMNKEYITSVFCINKAHPELHCDGTCFLAKKLKDLEGKNKQIQDNLKRVVESDPSFTSIAINGYIPSFELKSESGFIQQDLPTLHFSIFQPPKLVS
ncbi:hypothetical protein [Pedobacter sandarakinus]|uniref:hypothetical protein n=1 Tax=Pedobacter sandarakinus TaxID=353156 RepID=UPI002246EFDD|nr:hypothetical protein [Pedobacter sandarakinus]MCX2574363.1 hypothetical protein [Pedobacter sandarakinus]